MYRYTIEWKSYPMDRSGVKSSMKGVATFESKRLAYPDLHDEVQQQVRREHPELSATPILLSLVDRRNVKEAA
jgi:hypothetical protein